MSSNTEWIQRGRSDVLVTRNRRLGAGSKDVMSVSVNTSGLPTLSLPTKTSLGALGDLGALIKGKSEYLTAGADVDLYVSPDGSDDDGLGTEASPYASALRALQDIPDLYKRNFTIHLASGDYENLSIPRSPLPGFENVSPYTNARAIQIRGDALVSESVTLVSAAAASSPNGALVDLDIGAFAFAIPAGSYVVQNAAGIEAWYPIISSASPSVRIVGQASVFTPSESLEIRSVDVNVTGDSHINGFKDLISGVNFQGRATIVGLPGNFDFPEAAALGVSSEGELNLENVWLEGSHCVTLTDLGGGYTDLVNGSFVSAVGPTTLGSLKLIQGLYDSGVYAKVFGNLQLSGAGMTGITVSSGDVQYGGGIIVLATSLDVGIAVEKGGTLTFGSVTGTGNPASKLFVLTHGSQIIGSDAMGFTSTAIVDCGANTGLQFGSGVPTDDLASAAGTRQLCRVS